MKISSSSNERISATRRRSLSGLNRVDKPHSTTYVRTYSYNAIDNTKADITVCIEQRQGRDRRKQSRWCLLDTRCGSDRRAKRRVSLEV